MEILIVGCLLLIIALIVFKKEVLDFLKSKRKKREPEAGRNGSE